MKSLPFPVSIQTTTRPPSEADITQHRSIRLDALRTNPDSFLSTYARESEFDHAKWRGRLEQEGVWTFYAKFDDEVHQNLGDAHIPSKPWLATLSLLSPSFLSWFLASSCTVPLTTNTVSSPTPAWPLSLLGPGTDIWLIVGLWVRPEWRRKGVAQKIVEKAVHFVITSPGHSHPEAPDDYQCPSGSSNSKTTVVLLEVFARNRAAVELYRSVGFKILNPEQSPFPELTPSEAVDKIEGGSEVSGECEMEEPKTHWMGFTIPPLPPHRSNL